MDRRTTTTFAVALGGAIGAWAAISGSRTERRPTEPVEARPRPEPAASRAATPPPTPRPTPEPSSAPPRPPPALPAPSASAAPILVLDAKDAELRCARRDAHACLAAADAYEIGRGSPPDPERARLHVNLAVGLLNELCTTRDPEACFTLASLVETGRGPEKNQARADALRERARTLCQGRSTGFCARFGSTR